MSRRKKRNNVSDMPIEQDSEQKSEAKHEFKYTKDAKTWHQRYDLAYNNQKAMFKKFSEWYETMYAIKTYKNISIWKSKVFIPIMSYKAWTIVAKLLAMRPGFSVKIYDKLYSRDDTKRIEKANLKLEYDYDNPYMEESIRDRLFDSATDAVVTGTGYALAPWCKNKRRVYRHAQSEDGLKDYGASDYDEHDIGYNDLDPVDVFDVFVAPGKRSIQRKPWIIIKSRKTLAELLSSEIYDKNEINSLKASAKANDEVSKYKQARNKLIGQTQELQESIDDTVESFDVYECYERTPDGIFLCTFVEANRKDGSKKSGDEEATDESWVKIREVKSPYWHNKYPLVPFYIRRKPHSAWGESIFEITESMSNGYNDIFNQFADNLAIVGNGGILMHDTSTTIYDFVYGPGGEIRYSGTKPEFETPESPDIQFFTTMLNLLEKGVEWGTVSSYASGMPSDATDDTQGTATGISKLQEAAGEIASFMKSNFMQSLKSVGTMWLSNNRQFLDEDMMLEVRKHGKTEHVPVNADDFTESMVMTIDEASMQPPTRDEQIAQDQAWLNSIFAIADRANTEAQQDAQQPVTDAAGQPIPQAGPVTKPIRFKYMDLIAEVSDRYGRSDVERFVETGNEPDDNQENGDAISSVRSLVENGTIDQAVGQTIIDQIEGGQNVAAGNL